MYWYLVARYHGDESKAMYEDFLLDHRLFREVGKKDELTGEQQEKLDLVVEKLRDLPRAALVCYDNTTLWHPGGQEVRLAATEALRTMSWPRRAPAEYEEVSPGGLEAVKCFI